MDFWEALADVKRRFSIDEDRIVIRGFSLGGHSAWHLGAHHAWQWAAVAPGAGFSESREFLSFFEKDKLEPTWWEEKLWQLYDAPPYAENFRNVPVVAYSGEKDRQKQAADLMVKALAGVGIDLIHLIGPATGHSYHPDTKVELDRLIDAARRSRARGAAPAGHAGHPHPQVQPPGLGPGRCPGRALDARRGSRPSCATSAGDAADHAT